jgi:DNA-binding CsgD family transcriptional regulator
LILLLHAGCRLAEAIEAGRRALGAAIDVGLGPSHRAVLGALYARALVDAGEWAAADDLLAGLHLPNAQRLRAYVTLAIAELAAGKGDVELARRMLADGRFDLVFLLALRRACLEAELALAEGEPHVARAIVDENLPLAELIPDASHPRMSATALLSLTTGDTRAADAYLAGAERRAVAVAETPAGAPIDLAAWLAAVRAAHATVTGSPAVALWHEAADAFGRAGLVVRRAWAQQQEATAIVEQGGDRREAAAIVGEAHALAVRLGAEPLRHSIEALVRRARLDVRGIARAPEGDLGLTAREAEVLRLVAQGRTNREIANELYISTKTASVHVSNILRKVGATTRGEAAAIAHRAGLASSTEGC